MIENAYDRWQIQMCAVSGEIPEGTLLRQDTSMFAQGVRLCIDRDGSTTDQLYIAGTFGGTSYRGPGTYYQTGDLIHVHPIQIGDVLWVPRALLSQYIDSTEMVLLHRAVSWVNLQYIGVIYDYTDVCIDTMVHKFIIAENWDFKDPAWMHRYIEGKENPQVGGILL